jgi:hypothetical protein
MQKKLCKRTVQVIRSWGLGISIKRALSFPGVFDYLYIFNYGLFKHFILLVQGSTSLE